MKSEILPVSVSLIIATYNNEDTVTPQLIQCESILKQMCKTYEIIVCDDRSSDKTASLLREYFSHRDTFVLIFHKVNHGISKTIRFLYDQAKNEYMLLFSVDGDWNPEDLKKLITRIYNTHSMITIGIRDKHSYSFYRRLISFFYNFLILIFFNVHTVDAGSIKIVKTEFYRSLSLESRSIFFEAEMIIRAMKQKKKVTTVPIQFKKRKPSGGGGKIQLVFYSFKDLLLFRIKQLFAPNY